MKIKALIGCSGIGYNLKKDDEAELPDKLGHKLIKFGYVQEIKDPVIVPTKVEEQSQEINEAPHKSRGTRKKK